MKHRVFDDEFKKMAVELSRLKGSVKEAAEELDLSPSRLSKWRNNPEFNGGKIMMDVAGLSPEQMEIRRLKKALKNAELERDNLKKGGRHLFQGRRGVYRFIAEHKAIYPVEKMSSFFGISSSSYYKWTKDPVGFWQQQNSELLVKLKAVYSMSKGRYGSPRITKELNADGIRVSRPRIARLMCRNGIKSIMQRKYKVTTNSNHLYPVNENLLLRDFSTTSTGEKWVSDITYIRTCEGWLYLTVVMDLADRKIIGWSMDNSMSAGSTVVDAWKMAIKNRPLKSELIFHSDQGIQYASHEFRRCFKGLPVLQSMSRKGNCWDNAIAESFFKTLKTEMVYHRKFETRAQAKLEIFDYIEVWYNRKRRHSALDYRTPVQVERAMLKNKTEAA
nr:IS3 family transposase [Pedobacter nototheniae]